MGEFVTETSRGCNCVGETPQERETTIKKNLDQTIELIKTCNGMMDEFINFVWAEDPKATNGIEVKGFDTAVVCAKDEMKMLYEKINMVLSKFGAI